MIVECPHVGIRELSEAWGVSARTVKEWLASAGIKTVVRGRYRISDVPISTVSRKFLIESD